MTQHIMLRDYDGKICQLVHRHHCLSFRGSIRSTHWQTFAGLHKVKLVYIPQRGVLGVLQRNDVVLTIEGLVRQQVFEVLRLQAQLVNRLIRVHVACRLERHWHVYNNRMTVTTMSPV